MRRPPLPHRYFWGPNHTWPVLTSPPPTHTHRLLQMSLLAACPGAWSRLRRLAVADCRDVLQIPSLPSLASLAGLSSLRLYQRDGFALPGPLTALRHLAHLHAAASPGLLWVLMMLPLGPGPCFRFSFGARHGCMHQSLHASHCRLSSTRQCVLTCASPSLLPAGPLPRRPAHSAPGTVAAHLAVRAVAAARRF